MEALMAKKKEVFKASSLVAKNTFMNAFAKPEEASLTSSPNSPNPTIR